MSTPVRVLRWSERHGIEATQQALIVTVGGWDAGLVSRTDSGWTAYQRPRGPFAHRRRHVRSTHETAAGAVAVILASRLARRHGSGPFSPVWWTEAAALLAREPMEARS